MHIEQHYVFSNVVGYPQQGKKGIEISYCTDNKSFNLKRLKAKTKVEGQLVHGFLFTDDNAFNIASGAEMQQSMA